MHTCAYYSNRICNCFDNKWSCALYIGMYMHFCILEQIPVYLP